MFNFLKRKKDKTPTVVTAVKINIDGTNIITRKEETPIEKKSYSENRSQNSQNIFSKIKSGLKSSRKEKDTKDQKNNNSVPLKENNPFPFMSPRMTLKDQTLFAKRLSFLVKSGVPILESMHILKGQMKKGSYKIFDKIIVDISNGQFLHTSLSRFRSTFGDFAINIIKVGETTGILGDNLSYLAEELKKREELRKKVVGSLVYPIFITIATLGVSGLLTAYIFPKIMPIFSSLNVELPLTTRILLAISEYLRSYGILTIFGLIVLFIITMILHKKSDAIKGILDRVFLRTPILGNIMLNYNMANFCRTLGILLKGGMNVTEAIRVTGDTTHNLIYKRECYTIASEVTKGRLISTHMEEKPKIYPALSSHMIAIGEKTGNLSDTLLYLAEMYEHEVEDLTKNLSNSIEPVLMIFMGLIVGFVAVSVITPIYEVTKSLQR